ncbi:SMC domain protein [Calothrix sp. NIES-4101]|nr:SMC domain protein [Calothrix sp. NIES-4101]
MWISEIKLNNFRSYSDAEILLSKNMNLIVGSNNSGKSTLLKSVLWLQQGFDLAIKDLRIFQDIGYVQLEINDLNQKILGVYVGEKSSVLISIRRKDGPSIQISDIGIGSIRTSQSLGGNYSCQIPSQEPDNFIYPYLSKRKVSSFQEIINSSTAQSVTGNLVNLYAKIDRISNTNMPANEQYVKACQDILGFPISAVPSAHGKQAAYIVGNFDYIPLDSMGEGVAHLLGLIVDLCIAENKIFVIEEPENDVHPKALKSLLALIAEKSKNNQFIITTHSNIVTKYLGAQSDAKIFNVTMEFQDRLPKSQVEPIENTAKARQRILEELGYEFFDFDLWSAWLILEESSAERIIREYLIPWFVPELKGRLRTFSARSLDEVESKFEDFNNLFVFLHLQPTYKNKAWVAVDGGERERKIVEKLKTRYVQAGWNEGNFIQFTEHDFEQYYPSVFKTQVDSVLEMSSGKHKQQKKKALLEELITWITDNNETAKLEFEISALQVIEILRQIETALR